MSAVKCVWCSKPQSEHRDAGPPAKVPCGDLKSLFTPAPHEPPALGLRQQQRAALVQLAAAFEAMTAAGLPIGANEECEIGIWEDGACESDGRRAWSKTHLGGQPLNKAEAHRLAHKLRYPKFYTARTKRAVNSGGVS